MKNWLFPCIFLFSCNVKKKECFTIKEWHGHPIENVNLTRSIEIDTLNCNAREPYSDLLKMHPDLHRGSSINYINEREETGIVTIDGTITQVLGGVQQKIVRARINIKNSENVVYLSSSYGLIGKLRKKQLFLVDKITYSDQRFVILSKELIKAVLDTNLSPIPLPPLN